MSGAVERQTGTVKMFHEVKGYGFVAPDGGGKDLFTHVKHLPPQVKELRRGQRVEFTVAPGREPGKEQATDVTLLG